MVYATGEDLILCYDVSVIGQLVTDDDTPVPAGDIPDNVYVVNAIGRASADIRQAAQWGNRYTDEDLIAIYESEDESLKSQIVSLCCDRAYGYLLVRRSQLTDDWKKLALRAQATDMLLDQLRNGFRLFTLPEQKIKGSQVSVAPVVTTSLNSITKALQPRFFPWGLVANNQANGTNP